MAVHVPPGATRGSDRGRGEPSGEEGRVLRLSLILATQSSVLKSAGGFQHSRAARVPSSDPYV